MKVLLTPCVALVCISRGRKDVVSSVSYSDAALH